MDRTHGGRVEAENETALGNALGDAMAEQTFPGVFAGGKQIVRTETTKFGEEGAFVFWFDDGSAMAVVGQFRVEYKQPGAQGYSGEDVIEGKARELDEGPAEIEA